MTDLDRRTVLRGAGAAGAVAAGIPLLAACGGGSSGGSGGSTSGGGGSTTVTVATADVPVKGGVIKDKVVVTQPTSGDFKAFSAVCPHQGCTVAQVADDVITCPCHGSKFKATDGSHISGPATRGLTVLTATVSGADVTVT